MKKTPSPEIETYKSFGSPQQVVIIGRVHSKTPRTPTPTLSVWRHARYIINEYIAKPSIGHTVFASIGDTQGSAVTDASGMFYITIEQPDLNPSDTSEWHTACVWTTDNDPVDVSVLVEGEGNSYGVISDIDDTVLVSSATNKLKLVYITFFKRITSRKLFTGVVDLYDAFVQGSGGQDTNPIFYVSSSHWSLYYLLTEIFVLHKLPSGPLLLKEVPRFPSIIKTIGNHEHKHTKICMILETYPTLPFVLIGDSGQHDTAIYQKIVEKYGDRVKAVYIRDVTPQTDDSANPLPEEARTTWYVATSSDDIHNHAKQTGLLP